MGAFVKRFYRKKSIFLENKPFSLLLMKPLNK